MNAALVLPEYARPIRRHEYDKMVALGLFAGERVELLYGVIVVMPPKGAPHESAIQRLNTLLVPALLGRATVRVQSSFAASDGSEPEPDVAVVPPGEYRDDHPSSALLLIEVADSSLTVDRGVKAQLYAESGVAEYWVVNVRDGIVEVHSEIVAGVYTRIEPFRSGDRLRAAAFPDIELAVSDIL
jgi:Uma2 family endonuclease